jgi:hypothetical protein
MRSNGPDSVAFLKRRAIRKAKQIASTEIHRALAGEHPPRWNPAVITLQHYYITRPIDPDNVTAMCKAYIDTLQFEGVIVNDRHVTITTLPAIPAKHSCIVMTVAPN